MNDARDFTKSWVVRIIIINVIVFLVQLLGESVSINSGGQVIPLSWVIVEYMGLIPKFIVEKFYLWQFVTYMFLHGGFMHILFNMYALLIFGIPIEQAWGSRRFLIYYFFTGIGAGVTIFLLNYILGGTKATIGASGAVFGLLLAFGMLFPDAEILLFFIIPMKAKFLVILFGGIEFYLLISSGVQSPISHAGHLGGILFGLIYMFSVKNRKKPFRMQSRMNMYKTKIKSEMKKLDPAIAKMPEGKPNKLLTILRKLKKSGHGSLTDDEYQYIHYMDIMYGDVDSLCEDEDFEYNDDYCKKCKNFEACILREIRKYS